MSSVPAPSFLPWQRALVLAVGVALARAAVIAARDGYFLADETLLGLRSSSRHLLTGTAWACLPLLLLALAADPRRGRHRPLLVGAVTAVATYLFVAMRLPAAPWYAPGWEGTRALGVQAAALLVGLAAGTWLLTALGSFVRVAFLAVLAFGLGAGLVLLGLRGVGEPAGERPNVILISLDTLRTDHLGCYGHDRPTTPELDRFASDAFVFEQAFSPQPWTLTAHASMLTGLYPSAHAMSTERALPPGIPTLAQVLGRNGLTPVAVVDRVEWLQPLYGLDRGFRIYENLPDDAHLKVDRILGLLDDLGDTRFFLFAHFYDAHSDWGVQPYDAGPQETADFVEEYDGPWEAPDAEERASRYLLTHERQGTRPPQAELEHIRDQYAAGVRTLDRELGRLLAGLDERGLLEGSIVLVTADHGEEFFEHGGPMHRQMYGECVSIPFLLRVPGQPGGRSDALVSLVDVLPTLLDLAGCNAPANQGRSLAPLVRGEQLADQEHVLLVDKALTHGLRAQEVSVVPLGERTELYDLRADPGEEQDLRGVSPAPDFEPRVRRWLQLADEEAALLRAHFTADQGADVTLSDEGLQALRALGYLGDEE